MKNFVLLGMIIFSGAITNKAEAAKIRKCTRAEEIRCNCPDNYKCSVTTKLPECNNINPATDTGFFIPCAKVVIVESWDIKD